jgi:tetratricopeptide (TPR) repeat protein
MSSPQTSSSTTYTLSEHDKRIANILLYSGGELAFTPQSHDQVMETTHVSTQSIKAELLEELKALERKGVERAEAGDVTDAVALFTKAIDMAPNYASAYNNRAQARRLQGDLDGAMEDLEYAIRYAGNDAAILKQASVYRRISFSSLTYLELGLYTTGYDS